MRVDLVRQRLDLGGQEQLFLFFEAMFDARVVPDLDGRRHGQHRREQNEHERPERLRIQEKQTLLVCAPPQADRLTNQLEADGRHQERELPIDLTRPQHLPDSRGKPGHDKRREMPDGFLRTEFAQAAAGEPAPHGKRQRDEFAVGERRNADHHADDGARVGAGHEAGEERAFERQVRGLVVEEEPDDDAQRERQPERQDERLPIGPVAALEDQNVPEAPVAHQHGGQGRHHRQFHDQCRDQHLPERKLCGGGHLLTGLILPERLARGRREEFDFP